MSVIQTEGNLGIDDIDTAYGNLHAATEEYYIAQGQYNAAKAEYETARVLALAKGEIQGKNVDMRRASELEILYDEKAALFTRETAAHLARLSYELAQVDVKWISARLELEGLGQIKFGGLHAKEKRPTDQAGLEADAG